MSRSRLIILAALVLLLAAAVSGASRDPRPGEPYALLFGTVYNPENRPVAGVKIQIRRAEKKKPEWRLVSDRRGEFAQRVPAGKAEYVIVADIKTKGPKPEVKVQVENDERLDISLHLTE
jgi:hypothetical protein